jgi:hypothetical protein
MWLIGWHPLAPRLFEVRAEPISDHPIDHPPLRTLIDEGFEVWDQDSEGRQPESSGPNDLVGVIFDCAGRGLANLRGFEIFE